MKTTSFLSSIFQVLILGILLTACAKNSPDAPVATVPERLEIAPAAASVKTGESTNFTLKYFNTMGNEAPVPSGVTWSSSATAIATVNASGQALGITAGQADITAKVNAASAKALLTVVTNDNDIATITIEPALQELVVDETATLTAVARNINNQVITGKTFKWQGSNASLVELTSATGAVKGKAWGTAEVTASVDGKMSAPIMVQVIRRGTFSGAGSAGIAKLKIVNNVLQIETNAAFSVSTSPPDLRIYLSPNSGNANGALEIGTLTNRTGAQTWNIPAGVSMGQYRYALVWCKRLGGVYGVADLGN